MTEAQKQAAIALALRCPLASREDIGDDLEALYEAARAGVIKVDRSAFPLLKLVVCDE
jgi:predicted outer membrane protein